jgi:hypothetical protein
MNAITPAKEMPPAQSTATSGAFPTEHANERAATIRPITTFSATQRRRRIRDEERVEEARRQQNNEARDQNPATISSEHLASPRTLDTRRSGVDRPSRQRHASRGSQTRAHDPPRRRARERARPPRTA